MRETILDYLQKYPEFRERRNKNKWIAGIVLKKYGVEITPELKSQLSHLGTDLMNADRYWRMHTAETPQLRGNDWETKDVVEQNKEIELGYEPRYHEDTKHNYYD